VFWRSTPAEVGALLEAIAERDAARERAANLRAGLVAAAVYNVHRRKGAQPIRPEDFLREEPKVLTPEEMEQMMDGWMLTHNARQKWQR
jgi:hypothetical protein